MRAERVQIGTRLELFVDHYLIDKLEGAQLKMHVPVQAPPSPSPVKGYYMTVIKDGDRYRAYYREQVAGTPALGGEHLYTNNTHPYFRAPHIYIALPTRFLPERGNSTDILLRTSRGGGRYDRTFMDAFISPGLDVERWGNRSNYAALNIVPTGPAEMSVYHAPSGRRYVLRTDGFVSVHAGYTGGEMVTKAFDMTGRELVLNYGTSAAGSVRVEVQSPDGKAMTNYSLPDCRPLVGDEIEGIIH